MSLGSLENFSDYNSEKNKMHIYKLDNIEWVKVLTACLKHLSSAKVDHLVKW